MTTEDAPPAAPAPPPPPTTPEPRLLRRTREDRVIAGVCGGLGRYLGVDPVIFRVVLAVLVVFGGVGAILYIAGWLFLAQDGDTASPVEALIGRGNSSTTAATTILLGVLGAVVLGIAVDAGRVVLLALAVIGVVLLARHNPRRPEATPGGSPEEPAAQLSPTTPYAPHGPFEPYVPPPPRPPRERSPLGRITLSAAVVVLGILVAVDQLRGVRIPPAGYAAAALAVVGAGLLVGAWFGRARWLIVPAVAVAVALGVLSTTSSWDHGRGGPDAKTWSPTNSAAIDPRYELGAGDATLDLTGVDFSDSSVRTAVHLGAGDLRVRLPENVDVTVDGRVGLGTLQLFGHDDGGPGRRRTVSDLGADGAGGGTLSLSVDCGLGSVEVSRG